MRAAIVVQLVTLVGEPGVGKSRLCAELFRHVDERPELISWRQGRCLPYGEGIAFWALGEIVKAECGILESDSPARPRRSSSAAAADDRGARLAAGAARAAARGRSGEPGRQEESFAAWRRSAKRSPPTGPAVLVFEDLHWADAALLEFLEHTCRLGRGRAAARALHGPAGAVRAASDLGRGTRNAHRINLSPLPTTETARLVAALLEQTRAPRRGPSSRCWSGRVGTRSTRRSSCACSPTAASATATG